MYFTTGILHRQRASLFALVPHILRLSIAETATQAVTVRSSGVVMPYGVQCNPYSKGLARMPVAG